MNGGEILLVAVAAFYLTAFAMYVAKWGQQLIRFVNWRRITRFIGNQKP